MLAPSLQPTDRQIVSVIQRERLRMRAEFEEVIAGARQTIAQSQALLVEADAILAKEKNLPHCAAVNVPVSRSLFPRKRC